MGLFVLLMIFVKTDVEAMTDNDLAMYSYADIWFANEIGWLEGGMGSCFSINSGYMYMDLCNITQLAFDIT